MNKSDQGDIIVALAIYGVLKFQGNSKPERRRVLNFIVGNKLIKLQPDDLEEISTNQTRLENRLSWNRHHLALKGIIESGAQYYGIWRLPLKKIKRIEEWCIGCAKKYEQDKEYFSKISGANYEFTVECCNLILQIAKGDFKQNFYPR